MWISIWTIRISVGRRFRLLRTSGRLACGIRSRHLGFLLECGRRAARRSGSAHRRAAHPAGRAQLETEVAAVNAQLASYETVKNFHILPAELTVEGGDLTPSLKVKRKVVTQRFEREIAALYG